VPVRWWSRAMRQEGTLRRNFLKAKAW
jgi:hypothetical protein